MSCGTLASRHGLPSESVDRHDSIGSARCSLSEASARATAWSFASGSSKSDAGVCSPK